MDRSKYSLDKKYFFIILSLNRYIVRCFPKSHNRGYEPQCQERVSSVTKALFPASNTKGAGRSSGPAVPVLRSSEKVCAGSSPIFKESRSTATGQSEESTSALPVSPREKSRRPNACTHSDVFELQLRRRFLIPFVNNDLVRKIDLLTRPQHSLISRHIETHSGNGEVPVRNP